MKILPGLAIVLALVGAPACDGLLPETVAPQNDDAPQVERPGGDGRDPDTSARAQRGPSIEPRSKVYLGRMGSSGPEVRAAIADLKAAGFWDDLTGHLHRIDLVVKPGRESVPADRHLADARFWRARVAHGTYDYPVGRFCWIRFFPAAMEDDLFRWRSYYAQGLTGRVPPTDRHFWAGILGHELAHCPEQGKSTAPEDVALVWERKVLDGLGSFGN